MLETKYQTICNYSAVDFYNMAYYGFENIRAVYVRFRSGSFGFGELRIRNAQWVRETGGHKYSLFTYRFIFVCGYDDC